jgi:hypothetical protein
LATYESEPPDKLAALHKAKNILVQLSPTTSADAETVGVWGAIHKRLWELTANKADLEITITAYERGFFLKSDYYNGINYAFMLNVPSSLMDGEEALTDRVLAKRIRQRVLNICETTLKFRASPPRQHILGWCLRGVVRSWSQGGGRPAKGSGDRRGTRASARAGRGHEEGRRLERTP